MQTQDILDALKTKALREAGPSRGDVFPALVDWIAARSETLQPDEMDLLMNVSLVLYKHELEKHWHVPAARTETERMTRNDEGVASPSPPVQRAPDDVNNKAFVDAVVAMRQPTDAADALFPPHPAPRRRWTDNPYWSLTIR